MSLWLFIFMIYLRRRFYYYFKSDFYNYWMFNRKNKRGQKKWNMVSLQLSQHKVQVWFFINLIIYLKTLINHLYTSDTVLGTGHIKCQSLPSRKWRVKSCLNFKHFFSTISSFLPSILFPSLVVIIGIEVVRGIKP